MLTQPSAQITSDRHKEGDHEPIGYLSAVNYEPGTGWPLQDLNLKIYSGELHTLLGGTDSGRALILQMLAGLVSPESGQVRIFGDDPMSSSVRQRVGVTLYNTHFPSSMRVHEVIDLVRVHFHDALSTDELMEVFEINYLAERRVETLDQGEERWIAVALAFAGKPDLVVLDQPTAAMDFDWRLSLWQHLCNYVSQGGSVVMSSHFISEAEAFADWITVLAEGCVVTSGTPDEIKSQSNGRRIHVSTESQLDLGDACEIEQENGMATIYADDPDAVVRKMIESGVDFADLRIDQGSLEEAIIKLTGKLDA